MDRKLSFGSSRKHSSVVFAVLLLCAGFLSGCGQSDTGDYSDYSQLAGDPVPAIAADDSPLRNSGANEDRTPDKTPPSDSTVDELATADEPTVREPQTDSSAAPATVTSARVPAGDSNLAAPRQAGYGTASKSGDPLPIKLLVPNKQFRKEEGITRATFDDIDLLKILNMQPVPMDAPEHFPGWLSDLGGVRVRIRGFMKPWYADEDLTEFLFVRDNGECCFGPNVAIYDVIAVTLAEGESTDYIPGIPFDVEGTFRIEPYADEVELLALYFLDDAVILK